VRGAGIVPDGVRVFMLIIDNKRDSRTFRLIAAHLPGQPVKIGGRLVSHEDRDRFPVPGEGHVGGGLAPVVRMKHVSLIEGPALPLLDGSGVAEAETVELAGLAIGADHEAHAPGLLALRRV
jgi:hypothetical protein